MLTGAPLGALEVRRNTNGETALRGRFPFNSRATLSDGGRTGRPRKEEFAETAFDFSIESPEQDIALLVGHSFDKILASKLNGSLTFEKDAGALILNAIIPAMVAETTHGRDALALLSSGLAVGLSPGFRIPPKQTVEDAEEIFEEDPAEGRAIIRRIKEAILFEFSIVTRPAYKDATVEQRNWQLPQSELKYHPATRWR
jgi:uncharacterized protein